MGEEKGQTWYQAARDLVLWEGISHSSDNCQTSVQERNPEDGGLTPCGGNAQDCSARRKLLAFYSKP